MTYKYPNEAKNFLTFLNSHGEAISIYKYIYAKKIDYSDDDQYKKNGVYQ